MAKSMGIRTNVSDIYVASVTVGNNGVLTFGTPEILAGTSSISVAIEKGENKVYESGQKIFDEAVVTGSKISLETHTLSLESEAKYLYGMTVADGSDIIDGIDDKPAYVAVGWAAPRSDGTTLCSWYFYTSPSKGDESYETSEESYKTPTDRYEFNAMPRPDTGKIKRRKLCATAADVTAFFAAVMPD